MNVLITGARGFVGRNMTETLRAIADGRDKTHPALAIEGLYLYDLDTEESMLAEYAEKADFVLHFAGVNRPSDPADFERGNVGFSEKLIATLRETGRKIPVIVASSIQAALENPYGISKRRGEELFFRYGEETGSDVMVYRFPNLFGKWCRPNYNSVIATFCHNITHGLPITVSDPAHVLTLAYIDDLMDEICSAMAGVPTRTGEGYCTVPTVFRVTLGEIEQMLLSFRASRETRETPNVGDPFTARLWATYLSYLEPEGGFSYPLKMNVDARGSFTEILRTSCHGQVSVNVSKPGIVKGEHWHHTKNEKFLVVAGVGVIRFRAPDNDRVYEYFVSGERHEVVDIPVGYTHNIENLGESDLVTIMWASECFDPDHPDTYFLPVKP